MARERKTIASASALLMAQAVVSAGAAANPAQDIVRALKRVESSTAVGIAFREYSSEVSTAKSTIDKYMGTHSGELAPEFKSHVAKAMCLYAEGERGWNARIANDERIVPPNSCVRQCNGVSIQARLGKERLGEALSYATVGYRLLGDVWNCARIEVAAAAAESAPALLPKTTITTPPSERAAVAALPVGTSQSRAAAAIEPTERGRSAAEISNECITMSSKLSSSGIYNELTFRNGCDEWLDVYLSVDTGDGARYISFPDLLAGKETTRSVRASYKWGAVRACRSYEAFDEKADSCMAR